VRYEPARVYQEDSDLRQVIKWIAIGVGAIVVVSALAVAYIAATFDPNDYKERIVAAVKEKTGRTLTLDGDITLSLYPSVGAKLGKAALTEPDSERPFASVESARVSVKVMPLLSKEVIVDAIDVQGLRLRIEREKSGRMNFDDLTGAEKPPKPEDKGDTPVKVDIARVDIVNADVTYIDRAAGTEYRLSRLGLQTGRVATGVTTPVELAATIASAKDKAQIDVRLDTKLTFDLERRTYKLGALDLSAKGAYAGMTALDATVKGNVEARTGSDEYVTDALVVALRGKRPDGEFDLKLEAPQLTLTRDKVDGGKLTLNATKRDGKERLAARINVGSVKGAYAAVKAGPLDADIEMQGEGRTYKAQLSGALTADLDRKTAGLTFSGKIDNSNVSGKAAVTRFSPLAVSFNLDADDLDADRLMGKAPPGKSAEVKQAKSGAAGAKDEKIDLSALKGIDASGNVRIGKLNLLNLKSADVRAAVKVAGGRLDVSPISAQLYQGSLGGSLSAQAADNAVFTVRQTLTGVAVGPLLRDAAQIDTLEGRGTVNANLTTRGATVDALKKALNGTAAVELADGSVKGIDIAGTIRSARTRLQQLRGKPVESASKTEKTDFTELKASFKIVNGVARNDDLSIKSPLLRVDGAGDLDIGNDRMNYVLKATLVATSKGQGGRDASELAGVTVPVRLTGALDAPKWSIDFGGMVTELAKSRLKDEILKRAGDGAKAKPGASIEDAIKDRLKGILSR
jgi:AsmA protein